MAYAVWLQGVGRSMLVKWWSKHYTVIYYLYIAVDFYWWLLHPGLSNVSVQSGLDNGRTAHCVWHRLSQDSLINEFNNNLIGIIQHDCFVFVSSVQFAGEPPPNVTFCDRGGKGENGKSMALVIIELFTAGLELGRTNAALSLVHSITETTIALLVIFIRTANGLVGYKEIRSTIRLQQDLDPDSADIHAHRVQTPAGLGSRLRRHPRPPCSDSSRTWIQTPPTSTPTAFVDSWSSTSSAVLCCSPSLWRFSSSSSTYFISAGPSWRTISAWSQY